MNSISDECNDLKKNYDACFNSWYTESFLRGETKSEPCKELFESYRACVLVCLGSSELPQNGVFCTGAAWLSNWDREITF